MKNITDSATILGMIEDGELRKDLSDEMQRVLDILRERCGQRGKAKGSVTLTIEFDMDGLNVSLTPAITSKTPPKPRGSTIFWHTENGLSDEHPRQTNLFEDVNARQGGI